MIPNPWVILGALGFWLVTLGGGMLWAHHKGAADNEAQHIAQDLKDTRQVLQDFQDTAKNINAVAGELTGISQDLSDQIGNISRKFRDGAKAAPLPADCRPDPFRVQSLSAAIASANSAAGRISIPAVPAHP